MKTQRAIVAVSFFLTVFLNCARSLTAQELPRNGASNEGQIVITEFADYQCPFCGRVFWTLRELTQLYRGQLRLEFKHFPLSFHPYAAMAHEAALAAAEQGKFWEMHDLLFQNQRALTREDLIRYATELGLDQAKFVAAIDSDKYKPEIERDIAEGNRLGVVGTPTFFINGKKLVGAVSLPSFQSVIDSELARLGVRSLAQILRDASSSGPEDAPIVMTVFADFQSPTSAQNAWTLESIVAQYPNEVRLVYRNFPLPSHPQAMLAHEAALAAAWQGKFWEMHEKLFLNQDDFTLKKLLEYTRLIGLDDQAIAKELTDHRFKWMVLGDMQEGKSRGVRGVPTVFINDERVDGLEPISALRALIEGELAKLKLRASGGVVGAIPKN